MKQFNTWFIVALLAIITVTCASQWHKTHNVLKHTPTEQKRLTDTLKLEDIVLYTDKNGTMYFDTAITKNLPGFTGDSIFLNYGYLFDLGKNSELRFITKRSSHYAYAGSITIYYFDLYHRGEKIKNNAAFLDSRRGNLYSFNIPKYDLNIDTTVIVTEKEAIEKAIEYYRPKISEGENFIWEVKKAKDYYHWIPKKERKYIDLYPKKAVLEVIELSGNFYYAYKVVLSFYPSHKGIDIFVDSKTGDVLHFQSIGYQCNGGN